MSDTVIDPADMATHAEEASDLLKALANPNRLMLLCMLVEGERCVSDLNQELWLSQSALSQHLARLRQEGLVETRREGQTIYYRLVEGPALAIVNSLHAHYCERS
jgi:DNA-binding transcriptional ArsR family regulator